MHVPAVGSRSPTYDHPVWVSDWALRVPAATGMKGNTRVVPESRAGLASIASTLKTLFLGLC